MVDIPNKVKDSTVEPCNVGINTVGLREKPQNKVFGPPLRSVAPESLRDFSLGFIESHLRDFGQVRGETTLRDDFGSNKLAFDRTRQWEGRNVPNIQQDLLSFFLRGQQLGDASAALQRNQLR